MANHPAEGNIVILNIRIEGDEEVFTKLGTTPSRLRELLPFVGSPNIGPIDALLRRTVVIPPTNDPDHAIKLSELMRDLSPQEFAAFFAPIKGDEETTTAGN